LTTTWLLRNKDFVEAKASTIWIEQKELAAKAFPELLDYCYSKIL